MAGHSQFKNIMHRKGAQDAKRSKLFNKLAREITVAAKAGLPDPEANPRLRSAIAAARQNSMPRDRIERAMQQASGSGDLQNFEEVRYEGFGPGGVAIIIEALTDNRHRTAAELRFAFNKNTGTLGETGSVAFNFTRAGVIRYELDKADALEMFEAGLEFGAQNVETDMQGHMISTGLEDFAAVRDGLEGRFGDAQSARLEWLANSKIPLDGEEARQLLKLFDVLEDNDDVQHIYSNVEFAPSFLDQLTA
jgi:YebC/PmpR family DNA-binding regulatory protein